MKKHPKHKESPIRPIRSTIEVALLIITLYNAIHTGNWTWFIISAVFVSVAFGARLWTWLSIRKTKKKALLEAGVDIQVPIDILANAIEKSEAIANQLYKQTGRRCLRMTVNPDRKPNLTDTKLGGAPWWDFNIPYPTDTDGRPMMLVFQINFGQVPKLAPLPESGMLQFFITSDPENYSYGQNDNWSIEQRNFRVVYHPTVTDMVTHDMVQDFPRCEEHTDTAPVYGEYAIDVVLGEDAINVACPHFTKNFSHAVKELYSDEVQVEDPMDYLTADFPEGHRDGDETTLLSTPDVYRGYPEESDFQMLGYPRFEQYDYRNDDIKLRSFDTLLLQIPTLEDKSDESDGNRTLWGDCGSARLFISYDDLIRRDFSRVFYETQCY